MIQSTARSREWVAELLESIGTREVGHTNRTLFDHLLGTFDLLRAWDCDLDVCVAGGLHSIYGTNAFTHGAIAREDRHTIEGVIGPRAARLIYLFGSINRPRAILTAFEDSTLVDRISGNTIATNCDELRDLLAIECANLVEQGEGIWFLRSLTSLAPQAAESLMSKQVFEAVRDSLTIG